MRVGGSLLTLVRSFHTFQSLVSHGGSWTAEAQEPSRREVVALRAKLGNATDEAQQQSIHNSSQNDDRLMQHAPDVSTLACLTEASKGNFVLDSLDSRKKQQKEDRRRDQVERARAVLDNHVERMENEAKAEERLRNRQASANASTPRRSSPPKKKKVTKRSKAAKKTARPTKHVVRPKDPPLSIPTHALMIGGVRKPSPRSTTKVRPTIEAVYDDSPEKDVKVTATKSRRRPTRQCHDCKSTTNFFRRCHYFMPDGSQCGKTYCRKCLENKYSCDDHVDWDAVLEETGWQ